MYAVIETGGKQYRVEFDAEIQVDRLDVRPGDAVTIERVLLVADGDATAVGQPIVDGASVTAEVLRQDRGEKIVVFKYKPKARTRVKKGHRAELTTLRIADIAFGGKSAAKEARQAESKRSKALREAEQQAEQKAVSDRELAARLAVAAEPQTAPPKRAARRKPAASGEDAAAEPVAADEPGARSDRTPAPASPTPSVARAADDASSATDDAVASAEDTDPPLAVEAAPDAATEGETTPGDAAPEAAGTDTQKDE
jgi:large subunit ribosomal protein L21